MIEKFNFYDIYGYFVPGLALLAILWMPFGLVQHIWPAKDWGSAIVALAFAYVLGHLTQAVATNAIPSREAKSGAGKDRYPSETVLDPGSRELPAEVQAKIASEVNAQFGLDIHIQNSGGEFDSVRNNAFLLARQVLIREKAASYAEQFQGMYALERGLIAVLAVGVAYFAGWAFSIVRWNYSLTEATVSVSVALLILVNSGFALLREKSRPTQTDAERKQLRDENRIRKQKLERIYTATLLVLFALIG